MYVKKYGVLISPKVPLCLSPSHQTDNDHVYSSFVNQTFLVLAKTTYQPITSLFRTGMTHKCGKSLLTSL